MGDGGRKWEANALVSASGRQSIGQVLGTSALHYLLDYLMSRGIYVLCCTMPLRQYPIALVGL